MRPFRAFFLAALLLASLAAGCARDRTAPGLYQSYCRRCHGPNGEGPKRQIKRYPYLNLQRSPMVLRRDREAVRQRIVEGHGPMPGYRRRLSAEELQRLIDFTLQLPSRNQEAK